MLTSPLCLHFSTWNNVELGDNIIQQLETQGLQMAKEKQHYFGESLCHIAAYTG